MDYSTKVNYPPFLDLSGLLVRFSKVKKSINESVGFLDEPYIRFEGQETQQETFFVEDPNFNVLEIKSIMGSFYKNRQG